MAVTNQSSNVSNSLAPTTQAQFSPFATATSGTFDPVTKKIVPPSAVPPNPLYGNAVDSAVIQDVITGVDPETPNALINPLKNLTSYNCIWSMAPMTPAMTKNPNMYQADNGLQYIIFSSAGRFDSQRVSTAYGKPEYFIDNVELSTINAPTKESGISGNTVITFDIIEPYSMGLFLQSIASAAWRSGYNSYLECPFILRLDFVGFDDLSQTKNVSTRFIPIKLTRVSFTANESGSMYNVRAMDFNMEAFDNTIDRTKSSINISGSTVRSVMVDLEGALNGEQEKAAENNGGFPDIYQIKFGDDVKPSTAPKKIGESKFGLDMTSGGSKKFANASDVRVNGTESRDKNRPSSNIINFQFPQVNPDGRRITEIIEEVMKNSEYCRDALKPENIKDGYVNWYRIQSKIEIDDKIDPLQNRPVFTIKYYISPYKVHHSVFKKPDVPSVGLQEIMKEVKKVYNYIYTGLNDDIIRWELKINNQFFTAIPNTPNEAGNDASRSGAVGTADERRPVPGTNAAQTARVTGSYRLARSKGQSTSQPVGGTGVDNEDVKVARNFEQAVLQGVDLVKVDLEILGDPYYISSGGSYRTEVTPSAPMLNSDGSMSSEDMEIRVYLRFKTPIDILEDGSLYEFPNNGLSDSPFSGLYRVLKVKSRFQEGKFTQILSLARDIDQQPEDIKKKSTDPNLLIGGSVGQKDTVKDSE